MNQLNADNFFNIREYILLLSKLVAAVLCLYYIKHTSEYRISWPILEYFIPYSISIFLSNIGAIILVIPLTIIVTSILIPQNNNLHILSSLFGTIGVLITLIRNILFNSNIGEVTNFRFVAVQKLLTLPEKREIFITEFKRIINENYVSIIKTYEYLMSKITPDSFVKYDPVLNNLTSPAQIKQYAAEVTVELTKQFGELNAASTPFTVPTWAKVTLAIGGFLIVAYIINKLLSDTDTLGFVQRNAEITKDVAANGVSTVDILQGANVDFASTLPEIKQLTTLVYSLGQDVAGLKHIVDNLNIFNDHAYNMLTRCISQTLENSYRLNAMAPQTPLEGFTNNTSTDANQAHTASPTKQD